MSTTTPHLCAACGNTLFGLAWSWCPWCGAEQLELHRPAPDDRLLNELDSPIPYQLPARGWSTAC